MTTRTLRTCDFCGNETIQAAGWGQLVIGPYSTSAVKVIGNTRDICGACIAKISGWRRSA